MRDKNEKWEKVVRYCGMCKNSDTAQDLYKRARKGGRLTAKQIAAIEWYAGQMVELAGEENVVVEGEIINLPIAVPAGFLLYGKAAEVGRRGDWLVELGSSTVLGRFGDVLTLYPNAVIHPDDLRRVLTDELVGSD
jgi:hypothetical protein